MTLLRFGRTAGPSIDELGHCVIHTASLGDARVLNEIASTTSTATATATSGKEFLIVPMSPFLV
jgi:hypothetical protein